MIFKPEHISLIFEGKKTQTRRANRGKYQIGKSYAIQKCRTCKGIEGFRIVIDQIWEELVPGLHISEENALAEGGYTPAEYELEFRQMYPHAQERWAFEFHVIRLALFVGRGNHGFE
jgi:hypothetical protein